MIITEVKKFLEDYGPATIGVISVNLKCDKEVAEAALEHMIMQGRVHIVESSVNGCACSGCPGSCSSKNNDKYYALKK